MNKKLLSKRVVAVVAAMSLIGVPLMAKPVMKKITAYLNPVVSYTYDGGEILKDVNSITYENKTYVPVSEFAKALGKDVSYKNGKITVVSKEDTGKEDVNQNQKVSMGTIKEVNVEGNQVTILPVGKEDSYENYIVLNISDQTLLKNEKQGKLLSLKDLTPGMKVKAVHSQIATSSLPPQTPTYKIFVIDQWDKDQDKDKDKDDEDDYDLDDAVIKEINLAGKYLIVVEKGQEYKVIFNDKTEVDLDDDQDDKKNPTVADLKVGQIVDIEVENGVAEDIEVEDKRAN